jgi:hypothetical protein
VSDDVQDALSTKRKFEIKYPFLFVFILWLVTVLVVWSGIVFKAKSEAPSERCTILTESGSSHDEADWTK